MNNIRFNEKMALLCLGLKHLLNEHYTKRDMLSLSIELYFIEYLLVNKNTIRKDIFHKLYFCKKTGKQTSKLANSSKQK